MVNFVLIDGNIYVGFFAVMHKAVTFLVGLVGPMGEGGTSILNTPLSRKGEG